MSHKSSRIMSALFLVILYTPFLMAVHFRNNDEILRYVKSYLPESPVILEAGGNLGEDTVRMKRVWPQATMHVFEPLPSSFAILIAETAHLADVFCYPYALTSYSGTTHFYIDIPNHAASSIGYPVAWNQAEFDKTPIEVPCITLSDWAQEYTIPPIDFMWLDMEGHELYALQHASDLLNNVKAIFTEIALVPIREDAGLYPDLKKLLEQHGFIEIWKSCKDTERFGNALFIKKHLFDKL